jgi:DNA (cytosine-5)-methyltransferase 1
MPRRSLSVISLFRGAGGLDLGFEASGFETRVAVENDADAINTLEKSTTWPLVAADLDSSAG